MSKYSDYNIISIGDHCAISMILKELKLRKISYPFDWISHTDQLNNTNILYNISILKELVDIEDTNIIVNKYIGNAFTNNKINEVNKIWFPHESNIIEETFNKYNRRFIRLKNDIYKKNIFILLTRKYYIDEVSFNSIIEQLTSYNSESVILFISGIDHPYIHTLNNNNIIFKYIEYDTSKFYRYDYTDFRPKIKQYLSELLI